MKIITWNCQGAGNEKFRTNFKELVKIHQPDVVFILETKVSDARARTISTSLGYSGVCRAPTIGREGGIWMLWSMENIKVDIICVDPQAIHAIIGPNLHNEWLCSGIYARPNQSLRNELWSKLENLSTAVSLPWMLTGDFNEIVSDNEKRGGNLPSLSRCLRFKDMIDTCGLIDLGYRGPKFTWTNKREGFARVQERIDRSMANVAWQNKFPDSVVLHLPRTHSDHHPILTLCNGIERVAIGKPFRFELAWTTDPSCGEIVSDTWRNSSSILEAVNILPPILKEWNRHVFGNIFEKKRTLLARINGIQKRLCLGDNKFLSDLENDLIKEYNDVLAQEELHWYQKSRTKWLELGDRNTRFYHMTTLCRRRKNKVLALKINGDWESDDGRLREHVFSYFSSLFQQSECEGHMNLPRSSSQKTISKEESELISRPISREEIKWIVRSLSPHKAPGPDGLQAFFYQTYWDSVGDSVLELVVDSFSTGLFPDTLGESFICLIPKEQSPDLISKFRPIALCNVLYKIITKTLTQRIKPLMPSLVSPLQSSFIPGRGTHDNILMIQELLHSLRKRKKNKVGSMVIKLDLEKAYDRVSWVFLEQTLQFFGLPATLIKLIIHCVKSAKLRILWNGEPLDPIAPNCGLRQGDPLSPYLFVLCIERLSYMIGEKVTKKKWQPLSPCRGGPKLSHLFFADDLVLMAKATTRNARCIREVLDEFCDASGLKISYHKSKVFFAKGGEGRVKREVRTILNIGRTNDLGRYLGVQLVHERISPRLFRGVIDRVARRLSAWKAKLLSLAGRATLIKSVTSAVPNHVMQTAWLPAKICNQLDKLNRSFLWSSDVAQRKLHLVGWHKVTKSKKNGGLGLKEARKMNIALLAKIGWKTMNGDNQLWGDTFRKKYLKGSNLLDYDIKNGDSHVWKGIVRSMKEVSSFVRWRIGDGKEIALWKDCWVGHEPLISLLDGTIHEDELDWKVSDLIDDYGRWDVSKLRTALPENIKNEILSIPIPFSRDQRDTKIWVGTSNGKFSCKSAYQSLIHTSDSNGNNMNGTWDWIWKIKSSERLRFFIWLCAHNSLVTNKLRYERKLSNSNLCPRCNAYPESIVHALRDCPLAREIWEFVILPTQFLKFTQLNIETWIKDNLTMVRFDNIILPNISWHTIFIAVLWSIWKSRNKFLFQNSKETITQVIFAAKGLAEDLVRVGSKKAKERDNSQSRVKWRKPNTGWHKLNTDGSVRDFNKSAAGGGIIRNDLGDWIVGFTCNLGDVSTTMAELLAAREGLKLAWERRIQRLELEIDSKVVVNLIKEADACCHPLGSIILDCRSLIRRPWECRITHTRRSGNGCADALAKLGHESQDKLRVWEDIPPVVRPLLVEDLM